MHASKDSMWREIWKILQNFLETKQGLNTMQALFSSKKICKIFQIPRQIKSLDACMKY